MVTSEKSSYLRELIEQDAARETVQEPVSSCDEYPAESVPPPPPPNGLDVLLVPDPPVQHLPTLGDSLPLAFAIETTPTKTTKQKTITNEFQTRGNTVLDPMIAGQTNPSLLADTNIVQADQQEADADKGAQGVVEDSTDPQKWIAYRLQKDQYPLVAGMKFRTHSGCELTVLQVGGTHAQVQIQGKECLWSRADLNCCQLLSHPPITTHKPVNELVRDLVMALDQKLCVRYGKAAVEDASARAGIVYLDDAGCKRYCPPADELLSHMAGHTKLKFEEVYEKIPSLLSVIERRIMNANPAQVSLFSIPQQDNPKKQTRSRKKRIHKQAA